MLRFRFNHRTLYSLIIVASLFVTMIPVLASAQVGSTSNSGIDDFGVEQGSFDGTLQAPDTDLRGAIVLVVQYLLGFLGILMVIIILYGGYVWMTAGANTDRILLAKKIIINATIGLIIILTAFAIVSLIFRELGNGLGGGNAPCPGCRNDRWRSGIGLGPIESVYPEPNQREVPINTWIAVTFKEQIDPATICETLSNGKCAGGKMMNVDICILGEGQNCVDDTVPDNFSKDELAATKVYQTSDGRTFVFYPNKYLGLEDGADRDFYVALKSGINSKLTNESIFARWGGQQYHWQFTTNGELDLDPPEVVSTNAVLNPRYIDSVSGVFPDPDDFADTYSQGTDPTTTRFSVILTATSNAKIKAQVNASVTAPVGTPTAPTASISGTYGGSQDGTVTVGLNGNTITVSSGFGFVESQSYTGATSVTLGNGLQMNFSAIPVSGNSWTFTVTASQEGDAIEVLNGSTVIGRHVFGPDIEVSNAVLTAIVKIKNRILASHQNIFKDCNVSPCLLIVGMETIATGEEGGRYSLRFDPAGDDTTRANLVDFNRVAGSGITENVAVKGRPDVARNAIFQIQFNEAVNPLVIDSGAFVVAYSTSGTAVLDGIATSTASISNQYRTVELVGTEPCSEGGTVNQCGVPISCWPVNNWLGLNPSDYAHKATRFQVGIAAAPLRTCTGDVGADNWCSLWQGKEQQVCSVGSRCARIRDFAYYPGVDLTQGFTGLIDMSGNSLNGSFDYFVDSERSNKVEGRAQGQSGTNTTGGRSGSPVYDLNLSNPLYASSTPWGSGVGFGDDFSWSFWLSDKVELRSPLVSKIEPVGDALFKDFRKAVEVTFDKIMRSSTLRPGWNYGDDERSRSERYLVFDTITRQANPVGYWISSFGIDDNKDQFPDYTRADILHSQLDPNIAYGPQAGSGLQDVYQNCYLPGVGPAGASAVTCKYVEAASSETYNCSPSRLPNPASYAYMYCSDISGADKCTSGQICQTTYATSATGSAGSWIITKDFDQGLPNANGQGCCLGLCVSPNP